MVVFIEIDAILGNLWIQKEKKNVFIQQIILFGKKQKKNINTKGHI